MDNETFLYDKVNRRKARFYFEDTEGNFYLLADPFGIQMSGKVTIIPVGDNPNYEVREYGRAYIKEV